MINKVHVRFIALFTISLASKLLERAGKLNGLKKNNNTYLTFNEILYTI